MAPEYRFFLRRIPLTVATLLIVIAQSSASFAGTGTVKGKVFDQASKNVLPGATVIVKGTSIGAATDLNGDFVIHNVPSGIQTLIVSYVGYVPLTAKLNVRENQITETDFGLEATAVQGKAVVVTAQGQGQVQAINQQLSSNKIVNVVSAAKIQELPDFNAAEAIGRLPGISTLRSSGEADEIVIRGIAPQYNLVLIDGISLGATNKYNRAVDLAMVTPYMLQSIDVYKALTPDMNGDAIGGTVNMQLREAPSGVHTDLLWQSGYTAKDKKYGNYRAVGSVSDRFFGDKLGAYLLLNAESYDRSADNFYASYRLASDVLPGQQYAPVAVSNMTLDRHLETRGRYGGNLILDYKLPSGYIQSMNMVSRLNSVFQDFQTQFDYIGRNLNWNYTRGNANTDLAMNALQGQYDFGFASVELTAANTYTRNADPSNPTYTFTEGNGIAGTSPLNTPPQELLNLTRYDSTEASFTQITPASSDYKENDQAYKADLRIPFNFGATTSVFLKFGGEYRYNYRTNAESAPYSHIDGPALGPFRDSLQSKYDLIWSNQIQHFFAYNFSDYNQSLISNFLNDRFGGLIWAPTTPVLNDITSYLEANRELLSSQNRGWYEGPFTNLVNNYRYIERYYAGYGMAEIDLGPQLMIVGGARYEMDAGQFGAYRIKDSGNQYTQTYTPYTAYPKNHYWLPMVQAKYDFANWGDVRYAYTKTLARPDFTSLDPGWSIDQPGQGVNTGNPNLEPAQSFNHDLMFTVHSNTVGLFSVGIFYKTVKDFSYFTSYWLLPNRTLPGYDTLAQYPGAQNGASLNTFYNNPYKAYLKGVETDLETRLWYLPGPLSGIVLSLNYTHIWSNTLYPYIILKKIQITPRLTVDSLIAASRGGRLIYQPDDIFNGSIGYDLGGFSGRVSFLYQGSMVSSIGARVEQDGYTQDYFRVDASIRQLLPWRGFQIYLDVNNINQRPDISAQETIGGFTSEQYYGLTADLGVRYTL
ncbi:MAG: TonB-dependent receptor [Bacteroidetes bacterium]|nr:TonB-dependent receptor [Bacteroidota bacterium]